jgi:SagB-type dehydrogenase family enzyme
MNAFNERRRMIVQWIHWTAAFWFASPLFSKTAAGQKNNALQEGIVKLPLPRRQGTVSVEQAIDQRRTVRKFASRPLDLSQVSQLLWSAQGITEKNGFRRAVPSAGALYPMDVFVVAGHERVAQMDAGVYQYKPKGHMLSLAVKSDLREAIARAALSQMWIARAPLSMVITAEFKRITKKYKKRGVIYAIIEAGHMGQNLFLQAEALGLKASIVGAFHEKKLVKAIRIPSSHTPLSIMPIGYQA